MLQSKYTPKELCEQRKQIRKEKTILLTKKKT